ncbi:MAG TPA: Fe-S cluster assembly protein SufD [Thermoanaerobaculia bacterium]|nr:Fe-S cluster assembly protein SufD [Thermoanaerobaculia bacterium]
MTGQATQQPLRAAVATPESAAATPAVTPAVGAAHPAALGAPEAILLQARDRDLAAAAPYLADWETFQRELSELPELPDLPETRELSALRQAAIDRFAALGFPTTRQEEWRYTNLAPLARAAFQRAPVRMLDGGAASPSAAPVVGAPRLGPGAVARWTFDAAATLVFVDGQFAPELSTGAAGEGPLPPGILVTSLAAVLARDPRLVTPWLGRHTSFQDQPFVALNTAFLHDGAVVLLPRGAVLERPVHLLYLSTPFPVAPVRRSRHASAGAGAAAAAKPAVPAPATVSFPRNLIVAGEGSQLTVVETYAGEGAYFTCGVTELIAAPGAVVDHYKVQRESREAYHLATLQVYGDRASVISSHSISLGGGLVRNDVNALLDGEGIDCTLNGLYLADGRQLVDNHMRVEHAKPHCGSHELYKGILDGKARTVFNGLIHVHPGAQKTDAKQSNRNLLLSADAIANSNPRLEIFADDVRCTHGSTVGQLDADAVFYLRSRGIGEAAARSLLTYAFASDIVARIKVEAVRHDLEEYLFARLPQGEVVRQAV